MTFLGRRIHIPFAIAIGMGAEVLWMIVWFWGTTGESREDAWYSFFHRPLAAAIDPELFAYSGAAARVLASAIFSAGFTLLWVVLSGGLPSLWLSSRCGARRIYEQIRWMSLRERSSLFGIGGVLLAVMLLLVFWLPTQPKTSSDDSVFVTTEPAAADSPDRKFYLVNLSSRVVSFSLRSDRQPFLSRREFVESRWDESNFGYPFCGTGWRPVHLPPGHKFPMMSPYEEVGPHRAPYQVGLEYSVSVGGNMAISQVAWSEMITPAKDRTKR